VRMKFPIVLFLDDITLDAERILIYRDDLFILIGEQQFWTQIVKGAWQGSLCRCADLQAPTKPDEPLIRRFWVAV
jgi:hypothetical protein